jgi:ABC-type uncharacterized transport system auxiliary subunit
MITLPSTPISPSAAARTIVLRQLLLASGLTLTLLLCGCASRSPWKQESFALTLPASDETGPAAHTNILSLRRVTVSPLFEDQPLVYRTGENSYEQDPYAEFLVPPNRMLDECLLNSLRNGHAFSAVRDPGGSLKPACTMEVSVNQLYGDFRQPGKPFAVLQMHFILYGNEDRERVLWQRDFSKRVPLAQRTPSALLAGWNTALQQIMEEVNLELKRLVVSEVVPPNGWQNCPLQIALSTKRQADPTVPAKTSRRPDTRRAGCA